MDLKTFLLLVVTMWPGAFATARAGDAAAKAGGDPAMVDVQAQGSDDFLSSLGVDTHVGQGHDPATYLGPLRYLGVANIRDGTEKPEGLLWLHTKSGLRVDLLGDDPPVLTGVAKTLAAAGALMAIEGPNEPNNFLLTYKGERGGGNGSWRPVAEVQKDIYQAVHADPDLARFPVFHVSEGGAETNNVGLQYLTIPPGAGALFPDHTRFADYANTHNYVTGVHPGHVDNQAWQAASPTLDANWDGLHAEYGKTWLRGFKGYSDADLRTLPRVTTETGWEAPTPADEQVQGTVLVATYLAQFKQGWRYTFIYELGEGEGGGGHWGLFHDDWTPKRAATYIHNLTSILADGSGTRRPGSLRYALRHRAPTVHDLLLEKSDGRFDLIVWNEKVTGTTDVTLEFGSAASEVKIFDTTRGTDPIKTLAQVDSVPLRLDDHAMILEIR
jgi:hypothetical protein